MYRSTFEIAKMDCPSEEQLVKMALADVKGVESLDFDLSARKLEVLHTGDAAPILSRLNSLDLQTSLVDTSDAETQHGDAERDARESRALRAALFINLSFFVLEAVTGFLAGSMGLVADSLDMLADCLVFGLSLFAVGGTLARKKNVARTAGYFQLVLAIVGLAEVVRRFLGFGEVPEYQLMIAVSALALAGNALSIYVLNKAKHDEAHMQASRIFLSNDIVINLGVIIAGIFVFLSSSKLPDLIVGSLIFLIVARGASRILKLAR